MTQHSLAELKRQLDAASSAVRTARAKELEARERYKNAVFASTGFDGCLASFSRRGQEIKFLPVRMAGWANSYLEGPMIKKDGTVGERIVNCNITDAENLGPWGGSA